MIHILRGTDLYKKPKLASTMLSDRRLQFQERLQWPVNVDAQGHERDEYDSENPLYVILSDNKGRHTGSMRLLPTTGRTMISEKFPETLGGTEICDPSTWECTRFCLAPKGDPNIAIALLAVAARLMSEFGLRRLVAIFDKKMTRVYRWHGIAPVVLGSKRYQFGTAMAGFWSFDDDKYQKLLDTSNLDPIELELVIANVERPWSKPNLMALS